MNDVVKRTLKLLDEKGLTQAFLANKTGETPQTIQNWLKQRERIPSDKIHNVAKALGVSEWWLRYGDEEARKELAGEQKIAYLTEQEQEVLSSMRKIDKESRDHLFAIIHQLAKC